MARSSAEQHFTRATGKAFGPLGSWLSSTLALLPLFLLLSSLGLGRIAPAPAALTPGAYLWMAGLVLVLWLLSSLIGDFNPGGWPSIGPVNGIWVGLGTSTLMLLTLLPLLYYSLAAAIPPGGSTILLEIAFFLIGLTVGVMADRPSGIKMGGMLALASGCITVVIMVQAIVTAIMKAAFHDETLSAAGVIIAMVMIVSGVVFLLKSAMTVMERLEKNLKFARPSRPWWTVRAGMALLLLSYAIIIWYCYGGGWQAFQ